MVEAAPLAAPAPALTAPAQALAAQEPVTPSVTLTSGVTLTPTFTSPLPTPEPPMTSTLPLPEPSPTTTLRLGVLESTGVDRGWQLTYNAPNVGLFSGAATFDYPLEVPPGRNGLQPDLRLSYNSRRVDGLLGWIQEWPGSGWSIDTLDIVRTSVNVEASGAINVSNRSLLLMNGAAYELFPVNTALEGQPGRYYAKDAPQLYVEMYGYQPSGELRTAWRVRTPDGTTWNLGTTADASQYVSNYYNASNAIYRWRLAEAQDVHGNKLQVSYHEQRSCGRDAISLPSTIRYNNYSTSAWASEITFVRSTVYPPVDVRWDFCNLLVFGDPGALERVEVRHLGQLLRTYRLTTDKEPGEWSPTRDLRRLYAVQLWNGTLALPATTFAYTNLINKEACFECGDPHRESTYAYPRLSAITNGYGAQVEFLYERVGGTNDTNAGYDYRVQEQRTQDSIHTNPARTLYTYGTSWEKDYKVLGYDDVTVEARDYDGTTLLTRSQHWFNNPKTNTPGAAPLRGREYRSEADTGAPLPLRTDTLWGVRTQFTSTVTFGVVEAITTTDELGAVVAIGYTYDAYGNRVLTYDYGVGTRSDGDERTTRRFLFNLTTNGRWFIGLQWAENRYSGITTHNAAWLQTQTLHYFDGYTGSILDETAHQAAITKGLLTRVEQGKWGTEQLARTHYTYNSRGQLAETWDPLNARSTVAYTDTLGVFLYPLQQCNALNQCASTQYYGVNGVAADDGLPGQVKQITDPNGVVTARYTYDTWGRLQQVYRPQPTDGEFLALRYAYEDTATPSYVDQITAPNDAALRVTQRTFYDGLGRAVQSRLFHVPLADTTFTTVVQATEYDALGRTVCQLLPVNGGQQTFSAGLVTGCRTNAYPRTVTTYDALGRVAEVTQPDGARTLMQYQGRRTAVLDANNHQRISLADAYGQLIEVREYDAAFTSITWNAAVYATTQYTYDVLGNLTTVMDDADNQTTMEYDALGRKIAMDDPDMGAWTYAYDANGNLVQQTDAEDQRICFYYDPLNRLKGKTYTTSSTACPTNDPGYAGYAIKYWYDEGGAAVWAIGRRTRMEVPGVTTSAWTYDLRGRMTQETKTINGGGTFTTQYQYDDLDQVTRIIYPDGEQVTPSYTTAGQPKTLATTLGGSYVTNATYRAPGQISSLALGNGLTTHYTYDSLSARLTRARTGALLDLGYHYDAGGNVSRIQETTATTTQFSDAFTTKNTTAWVWNAYQTVPYADGGNAVVKNTGTGSNWSANFYRAGYALTHGETVRMRFKVTDANSQAVFALVSNDAAPRRFGVYAVNGSLQLQYTTDGTNWVYLPLWQILTTNQWYSLELRVDDTSTSGFVAEVCTETLPRACASQHAVMPIGKAWRFQQWVHTGSAYLDDYAEFTESGDVQTFTYDALDRLIEANAVGSVYTPYTEYYQYDPTGNLKAKTGMGVYEYPTTGIQPHAVTSAGGHTYEYDANGSMTMHWNNGVRQDLDYSTENRLMTVTVGTQVTVYAYDADGVLTRRTLPDGSTTYYVNGLYEATATGKALDFDGVNDYVLIPDSPSNGDFSQQITLEAWINPDTYPGDGYSCITTKGGAYYFNLDTTGHLQFYWYGLSNPGYHKSPNVIPTGRWTHVAATYDGSYVRLYENGVQVYSLAVTGAGRLTTAALGIGRYPGSAIRHFNGQIDAVRILNRALTATEILEDTGARGQYTSRTGTVGWYHLDAGSGTVVSDASGYNNHGTLSGAVWVAGYQSPTKYYYLGSQRVAMRQGGVLTYLHGDHLGSASLATNASGAQVLNSEQRYLPYGGTRSGFTGSGLPTDRQYTGQRREASLGFYDYVARQFDPALGRFLQADSIIPNPANPQSLNRYSYTLGNPLRYTDPSGHFTRDAIINYLKENYPDSWLKMWDAWRTDTAWANLLSDAQGGDYFAIDPSSDPSVMLLQFLGTGEDVLEGIVQISHIGTVPQKITLED